MDLIAAHGYRPAPFDPPRPSQMSYESVAAYLAAAAGDPLHATTQESLHASVAAPARNPVHATTRQSLRASLAGEAGLPVA